MDTKPLFDSFIRDSFRLRQAYWQIRGTRSLAVRRRFYRLAEKERGALLSRGWPVESIRLYCLHLADPRREARLNRFVQSLEVV